MAYRTLRREEIDELIVRGCLSSSWETIEVHQQFSPEWCKCVTFSGDITIGELGQELSGRVVPQKASLSYAHIHNCSIGTGVYINGVRNHIANYTIEDHVWIENINTLEVTGNSSFGNGVVVNVLHEQGGRAVTIYNDLSAQVAYMQAFYRHKTTTIENLEKLAQVEIERVISTRGVVGVWTQIVNTGIISNVNIGPWSDIHNSQRLKNGSILGTEEFPVTIGTGVLADDFIIGENSQLKDQAIISSCFVGSGCVLSRGFSAEQSLFFANSVGSHGEVFSIFAGPHTVTHHKATLLIGAYLSFLNAGSGSNQSNNLYKLGPLHQGVIERGSKTASDSYILWPARVGVFTLITGRHTNHCDTSQLPYSYLIEQDNESYCIPGVNLKSVGTIRDADKWPRRDRRSSSCHDIINYNLLSPYTVGKMEKGITVLEELVAGKMRSTQAYHYQGVLIPTAAAEKGITYYAIGVQKFLGNVLIKRVLVHKGVRWSDLQKMLSCYSSQGNENWVDMAGLLLPQSAVDEVLNSIESPDELSSVALIKKLEAIHENYDEWVWNWCAPRIEKALGCPLEEVTQDSLIGYLGNWIEVTATLDAFFEEDAQKEFNARSQIGFGLDGTFEDQVDDFTAVRGIPEDNPFVVSVMKHLSNKKELFERAQKIITSCA